MSEKKRLTANDFFIGMISALKLRGVEILCAGNHVLDRAFAKIFKDELPGEAEQNNLDLRFRIRVHPIHGDSQIVYEGILLAMQLGLVTQDSPGGDIRLRISREEAEYWIAEVPGSPDMYRRLAGKICA